MSQDKEKDYADLLRAAVLANAPMKAWKQLNAPTEQMMLEAAKSSPGKIDIDKLVESYGKIEALIEAERLHRAKRLAEFTELKTDLNKAVDELESLVNHRKKSREDWLDAGMPLAKPLKIKNKPLTFNKKPGA